MLMKRYRLLVLATAIMGIVSVAPPLVSLAEALDESIVPPFTTLKDWPQGEYYLPGAAAYFTYVTEYDNGSGIHGTAVFGIDVAQQKIVFAIILKSGVEYNAFTKRLEQNLADLAAASPAGRVIHSEIRILRLVSWTPGAPLDDFGRRLINAAAMLSSDIQQLEVEEIPR